MWYGFAVGPVSCSDANTSNPLNQLTARRAVKDEPTKIAL